MVHHLKDGEDFSPHHFSKDFGFHGSAEGRGPGAHHSKATHITGRQSPSDLGKGGGKETDAYSHGGHVHPHGHHVSHVEHHGDGGFRVHHAHGGFSHHHPDGHVTHHHAHGGEIHEGHEGHFAHGGSSVHAHPHGHHVTHVESLHDGSEVHHHAHGGYTIHHAHGGVSHHLETGEQAGHAGATAREYAPHGRSGGFENEGQYEEYEAHEAKMAHGGHAEHPDYAEDKAMIEKGFRQHDEHMHEGKHEQIKLARGGLPPAMRGGKPPMGGMPKLQHKTTPRNIAPMGGAPMGVEPSAEPNAAGSEQGIPQLRKGGKAHEKHHREHRRD